MFTPRSYFESLRERFTLISQYQSAPRQPYQENDSTYFVAIPVYPRGIEKPVFVPLDVVWERLHDRDAVLKNDNIQAAELLDVDRLQMCMIEETFERDKEGNLFAGTDGELEKYCKINPLPGYHDYDVLDAYTWEKHNDEKDGISFAIYEADCFLYWVIKSKLTFRLFVPSLLMCITNACKYTEEEKDQLYNVFKTLHRSLVSREMERAYQ